MWALRAAREWQVTHERTADASERTLVVAEPPTESPGPGAERIRFGFRTTGEALTLVPRLPDRPFVMNPESPFALPAGEEITIFTGVPLWIALETGQPAVQLFEKPLFPPSYTWFGSSPMEGELCYAWRTSARLRLVNLVRLPHRARAAVQIQNHTSSPLRLEKMKLPIPHVSLFESTDGGLWTERIVLDRQEDGDIAVVHSEERPPAEAGHCRRIAGPRVPAERRHLFRAFRLFGAS